VYLLTLFSQALWRSCAPVAGVSVLTTEGATSASDKLYLIHHQGINVTSSCAVASPVLCVFALQPPFNEAARAQAGFGPEWYMPLAAGPAVPAQSKAAPAAVQANAAAVAPVVIQSIPAAAAALQSVTL